MEREMEVKIEVTVSGSGRPNIPELAKKLMELCQHVGDSYTLTVGARGVSLSISDEWITELEVSEGMSRYVVRVKVYRASLDEAVRKVKELLSLVEGCIVRVPQREVEDP